METESALLTILFGDSDTVEGRVKAPFERANIQGSIGVKAVEQES
jgi:hypothetical protein